MEPQLYMWSGTRRRIIDRHNFYVEQVRTKVLAQFRNIEAEAEAYVDNQYNELASLPAREDIDMSELAEFANDRGQEFYGLLHDRGCDVWNLLALDLVDYFKGRKDGRIIEFQDRIRTARGVK
jgi:hypothetical protein